MRDVTQALETILPDGTPHSDSVAALKLIIESTTSRYVGDLESGDDAHNGGVVYWPSDKEEVREILADLWGAFLPAGIRDQIAEYLVEGTPDPHDWPNAFCPD
jgi:hypothetical protein